MPTWTGATNNNWNTASNWTNPAAVPTIATDAIFTNLTSFEGGGNCGAGLGVSVGSDCTLFSSLFILYDSFFFFL